VDCMNEATEVELQFTELRFLTAQLSCFELRFYIILHFALYLSVAAGFEIVNCVLRQHLNITE
jgi:hypothetical protein